MTKQFAIFKIQPPKTTDVSIFAYPEFNFSLISRHDTIEDAEKEIEKLGIGAFTILPIYLTL